MWEDTVQVFLSLDNTSYEENQNVIATCEHPSSKEISPMALMHPKGLPWQFCKTEMSFSFLFVWSYNSDILEWMKIDWSEQI